MTQIRKEANPQDDAASNRSAVRPERKKRDYLTEACLSLQYNTHQAAEETATGAWILGISGGEW